MADWIFQGNPDRFDVNAYLSVYRNIYWTVATVGHQRQVHPGDRVFLWRAAGSDKAIAGIVGLGTVAEPVAPKGEVQFPEYLGDSLWKGQADQAGAMKAGIALSGIRLTPSAGMITREDLLLHPVLCRLTILRFAQASNFPITPNQADRLASLWGEGADSDSVDAEDDYSSPEGAIRLRLHRSRERSRALVDRAKALFVESHGRLHCEICSFDFERTYGSIGASFIEAHHAKPLSAMAEGEETSVTDLRMVCSNCHRMLHRGKPSEVFEHLKRQFIGSDGEGRPNKDLQPSAGEIADRRG